MTEKSNATAISRREMAGLAAAAAALAATPALASNQPHMDNALAYCKTALSELKAATANKAGHRQNAIEHLTYVIQEIKAGIVAGA